MENTTTPSSYIAFPSHIVPSSRVPIEDLNKEVAKIDDKIAECQVRLDDIKDKQGEKSKAHGTWEKKIQDLQAKKSELYSGNAQYQWAVQFANALINYGKTTGMGRDQELYDYANATVKPEKFSHITELYAGDLGKALPAYIRQVNQAPAVCNRLVGEADATGLRYSVGVINSDAVNEKQEKHAQETADKLTRMARVKAGVAEMLGAPVDPMDAMQEDEEVDIADFNFNNYQLDEEVMVKRGLDYLMRKPDAAFKYKFSHQGFRNYIITSKMCFSVYDDLDGPNIKSVDSRDLFYILSPSSPFIQHGTGAGEYFAATPQELIDMMPELSSDEVHKLRSMALSYQGGQMGSELIQRNGCFEVKMQSRVQFLYLHCWKFNFRATKRVRVRVIENRYDADNPHIKYVDDKDNEKGANYEYRYVEEIWEGIKYGADGFYQLRPIPNQHIVGDYLDKKTLNYIGLVDPNPSLIQLVQPFESLRMQVFYAIERLMAQVQGKIMCVDEANESDNVDNAYNMKVYSVYRYNSAKEGDQQLMGLNGAKNLNKPEVLDLGLSSAISDLLNFVGFLDVNVNALTGFNGARRGEIKSDTGLGQMEQASAASAMSTQPYFTAYYTIVGMTLEKVAEQMQRSWGGKDIVKNFLGENGMELLNLMSASEWYLPRYGVFVENGSNDEAVKNKIYNLAQALMPIQTSPDLALALVKMINANSAKEAERIFERGVAAMNVINKQIAQSNAASAEQQQALLKMQEENKTLREQIKAQGSATVAEINKSATLENTNLKNEFKADEQTARKQDDLDLMVADKELNTEVPEMEIAE